MEAQALEKSTLVKSREFALRLGLQMKIGDVEYQGDKTKAIFYYTAEDRVDFRELIKVMAEEFRVRIEMRQIGARQFVQQNGVWTDQRYTQSQRMVRVKAYSPLYFELIAKLPGLSEALVLGEQVLVAGRSIAIQVDSTGAERMTERELADVVRGWN